MLLDGISFSHQDLNVRPFSNFFIRDPRKPGWKIVTPRMRACRR
jgi:hypothetical protein